MNVPPERWTGCFDADIMLKKRKYADKYSWGAAYELFSYRFTVQIMCMPMALIFNILDREER